MGGGPSDDETDFASCTPAVSHRPSIHKFHKKVLQFTGDGRFSFRDLDSKETERRQALQEEKESLETKLSQLPQWKERLEAIAAQ